MNYQKFIENNILCHIKNDILFKIVIYILLPKYFVSDMMIKYHHWYEGFVMKHVIGIAEKRSNLTKDTKWYDYAAKKDVSCNVISPLYWVEVCMRMVYKKDLYDSCVYGINCEDTPNEFIITISTAKPGDIIGKGGAKISSLEFMVSNALGKNTRVEIKEVNIAGKYRTEYDY